MKLKSVAANVAALGLLVGVASTGARAELDMVKIGVLTDLSGTYSDLAGAGSVWAAKKAVADYLKSKPGMKIEVVQADKQRLCPAHR